MNRKQLITLIVLGLVIGGLGVVFYNQGVASWKQTDQAMGQKILKDFPLNDIARVRIKQPDAELNLAKLDDRWTVKERWNYPANFSEVGDLLRKVWELKSVQTLKVGPSQYGRLQMLSPNTEKGTNAGVLVEFHDKADKTVQSLLLGKKATRNSEGSSPFGGGDYPVGRYVALADNPQNVWLTSETLADVEPKADHWLNKDFFKVEKLRSISVTLPTATNSWRLAREKEGGDLDLQEKLPGEEFDKNKAYSAGNALSYPSFNDVADPASKPEEVGLDHPILATIETFDNFVYSIKAAKAKGTNDENYHLQVAVKAELVKQRIPGKDEKPEEKEKLDKEFQDKVKKLDDKLKQEQGYEKWTYVVSKWTIDPLLKERKDFLADKKTDGKKPENPGVSKPFDPSALDSGLTPDGTFPPPLPEPKASTK